MKKINELGISQWPWTMWVGNKIGGGKLISVDYNAGSDVTEIARCHGESDARLIAAAPELYDCLREAVEESCHDCEDDTIENCRGKCHIARWRDALAKASGEIEVK